MPRARASSKTTIKREHKTPATLHEFPAREPRQPKQPKPPFPAQHQQKPGLEARMQPRPRYQGPAYRPSGKLQDKAVLVTGGDSGIGRAVAVLC